MNVLVTGGAGFIGSNLVEALVMGGYNVTVLDNFSAKLGQLKSVEHKIKIINASMLDESAVLFIWLLLSLLMKACKSCCICKG